MKILEKTVCLLIAVLVVKSAPAREKNDHAWISVHAPAMTVEDTLEIRVWPDLIGYEYINPHRLYTATNVDGYYRFEIDSLLSTARMSLHLSYQKHSSRPMHGILDLFVLMPGDSLSIEMEPRLGAVRHLGGGYDGGLPVMLENWLCRFSGKGWAKYQALFHAGRSTGILARKGLSRNPYTKGIERLEWTLAQNDSLMGLALSKLGEYRAYMDGDTYRLIHDDTKGGFLGDRVLLYRDFIRSVKDDSTQYVRAVWLFRSDMRLHPQEPLPDAPSAVRSPSYMQYLLERLELEHWLRYRNFNLASLYRLAGENTPDGGLKDRLLALVLQRRFHFSPDSAIYSDALRSVRNPFCMEWIIRLGKVLEGRGAYGFRLPDVHGNYHQLADFRGKVVFMDFWYMGCIPCRAYMRDVSDPVSGIYREDDRVVFITVSTDSRLTLKSVLEKGGFLPEHALHLYTEDMRFKHPVVTGYGIHSFPFPLLIDKQGNVSASGISNLKTKDLLAKAIENALR